MSEIKVTMRCFGAFRDYGDRLEFALPPGSPVAAAKAAFARMLDDRGRLLVGDSVLADDRAVLPDDFVLEQDVHLSILPPVCGG